MDYDLQDHVVLVTGATDGLGRGLSGALVDAGAIVLVHGRDPKRIDDTVAELEARGGTVRSYRADLSSLDGVRALAADVREHELRLDVLGNNAGIDARGGDRGDAAPRGRPCARGRERPLLQRAARSPRRGPGVRPGRPGAAARAVGAARGLSQVSSSAKLPRRCFSGSSSPSSSSPSLKRPSWCFSGSSSPSSSSPSLKRPSWCFSGSSSPSSSWPSLK